MNVVCDVDFICQMFGKQGEKIEKPIAEVVYDAFEGHTCYVQKTMNEAFSNTDKGTDCTNETILDISLENIITFDIFLPFNNCSLQ